MVPPPLSRTAEKNNTHYKQIAIYIYKTKKKKKKIPNLSFENKKLNTSPYPVGRNLTDWMDQMKKGQKVVDKHKDKKIKYFYSRQIHVHIRQKIQ